MTPSHWLDRLYVRLTREGSFFTDGWGDRALLDELVRFAVDERPKPASVVWTSTRERRDVIVREGRFESPAAMLLPDESRVAHVKWIQPKRALGGPVCVVLGATGDEGFTRRERWAAPLLREGVGALLLENPLYGARRPRGQRGVDVRTVVDLLLLGRGAVEEARSLAAMLHERGHPIALTGYSMGGQLAAMAGVLLPFDVAIVAAAAPSSATAVFVDGLLSRATAWKSLARSRHSSDVRDALTQTLDAVSLSALPPPRAARAAIVMGGRSDGYVSAEHVAALHRHWPQSELRWFEGGHVSGYVRAASAIRRAVSDALASL